MQSYTVFSAYDSRIWREQIIRINEIFLFRLNWNEWLHARRNLCIFTVWHCGCENDFEWNHFYSGRWVNLYAGVFFPLMDFFFVFKLNSIELSTIKLNKCVEKKKLSLIERSNKCIKMMIGLWWIELFDSATKRFQMVNLSGVIGKWFQQIECNVDEGI